MLRGRRRAEIHSTAGRGEGMVRRGKEVAARGRGGGGEEGEGRSEMCCLSRASIFDIGEAVLEAVSVAPMLLGSVSASAPRGINRAPGFDSPVEDYSHAPHPASSRVISNARKWNKGFFDPSTREGPSKKKDRAERRSPGEGERERDRGAVEIEKRSGARSPTRMTRARAHIRTILPPMHTPRYA